MSPVDLVPPAPRRRVAAPVWLVLAGLALAGPARAGDPPPGAAPPALPAGLAAPGECARPDPATSLVQPPPQTGVARPALHFPAPEVAGPLGPTAPLLEPPALRDFPGTGPCDDPGSGCLGALQPAPRPPVAAGGGGPAAGRGVRESPAQPGRPPGLP